MDIFSALPQIVGLIEKGGIIGLLVIFCGVLIWEIRRGRKSLHDMRGEMQALYAQRDRWRLAFVKCKAVCESNKLTIDLSDLADLIGDVK